MNGSRHKLRAGLTPQKERQPDVTCLLMEVHNTIWGVFLPKELNLNRIESLALITNL